jgi:S-DNA-T family DNA segregation ATPase FtsK/SpoIIIE
MSRLIFEPHRRIAPPNAPASTVLVEAPPQLPRTLPPSFLRRALPFVLVILIIGMVVALIASGARLISPQTLFFPFVLLLAATALFQGGNNKVRVEEVDAERADYVRYLSVVRENLRAGAAQQRAALLWSHPGPEELAAFPGTHRQWERDPDDDDYLVVRAGLHDIPLASPVRVKDIADEIDVEPVSHSALRGLLDVQRTVRDAPLCFELDKLSRITVTGDPEAARAAVRSWVAQAAVFHDPTLLSIAVASTEIEGPDWFWLKWLPHVDVSGEVDGVGPARSLRKTAPELFEALAPALADRGLFGAQSGAHRHLVIVLDDPDCDLDAASAPIPTGGVDGVTVIQLRRRADRPGDYFHPERPVLRVERVGAGARLTRWDGGDWQPYVDEADQMPEGTATHIARRLSRWDSNPVYPGLRLAATGGASFAALLGLEDVSQLDVPALWSPRSRDQELRVPIGVTASGEPLYFDLKDEAEGGMGPHGLMIGMTGSGKSQTLMSILLSLLTTHSADRLIVIYADFKGEAGADIFRDFPQVVAVISNMAEKRSLADRFADTLRGEVARRELLLKQAGRDVQGSAFNSVREYEEAIAAGHDLPPIPTLFVVADEFTLMLQDHPEYAELFDYVARKGRSFRIHILFASQTLDIGRIKDIDKNTSYRIGLKVASPSASRQIIGTEDAYHIESGKDHKGVGFLVPAPGAVPVKFRSTYVDGMYEPPAQTRTVQVRALPQPKPFTALPVPADPSTVIVKGGPERPALPARKLISTIGSQLAACGPRAPQLWLPPLDAAVPLADLVRRFPSRGAALCWPLGEIDRPFLMRRDPLVFEADSAAGNVLIHGGPKSGKSTALQTFVLSAAASHSPRDVSFYCIDYGGGQLHALEGLAHVGSVASALEPERVRRTFGELEQLLAARQRMFRDHGLASLSQLRERRHSDPSLDDGYGETFLLVDNLYAFGRDNTDQFNTRNPLLARLVELASSGLAYGIHVVATTTNWIDVPLAMRDSLGLRLELKLHDPQDSNVRVPGALRRPAESVPHDQPGRGLTMQAEHFLFAEPDLGAVDAINAKHQARPAPEVRLLPTNLAPAALEPLCPAPEHVVIGQREQDLAPVVLDFTHNPLLMALGDTGTGKTALLRHIIRVIRQHSTPDQVAFTVIDRRLRLVDEPLFPDNEHTPNIDRVIPAMLGLSALLGQRRPPAGLSAEQLREWASRAADAQRHYLVIDDADQIPDAPAMSGPYAGRQPWTPIVGLLAEARELGLRVIVTARATGSGHTLMTNPLLRRLHELQANTLMFSGSPHDSGKIRGHRFERLPAGRGVLLSDADAPTYVQTVNPLADEHLSQRKEHAS